ncbi:DsbA family protein [Gallionella capsiferriformans]|uniref:DSBA oxidoreductase n=1 Tax=Gallionella capsiferriformans (strain ES-2) TaxID=395494 RepID=D9SG56_GALCS|nr:DsbA family protein [Gallionella capsiferriformans]ADL55503.1 DSBA oxidoreductase [Gallionella capsiferriformans ES-2]
MTTPVLHYIFDPFCGWCYAAAPLVATTRSIEGLQLVLHGGGLMSGSARRKVAPALRSQIMGYDRRIAEVSGQPFGDAYFNGLLCNEDAVMDSTPPIAAILATEDCGRSGLDMLTALQQAHYIEGKVVSNLDCLHSLASTLGIDAKEFSEKMERQLGGAVDDHIQTSRQLMQRIGGNGFPTMVLETEKGFQRLDIGNYFGHPEQWRVFLQSQLPG